MPEPETTTRPSYDPANWYWIVAGSTTQVYSSARAAYVPVLDTIYQGWLTTGGVVTRIATEQELWDVLAASYPAGLPVGAGGTAAYQIDAATKALLNRLKTATPAEIDAWLDANTGNVSAIRVVLKDLCRVMVLVIRRAAY